MSFQCIICLQPLTVSGDQPAAIPCGHVYHKSCIRPWVDQNRNCPLCKKSCTNRQIISPLYLSGDDSHDTFSITETSEYTQNLHLQITRLTREKEVATNDFNAVKQALQDERVKSQAMASDLRGATKAIRHMKQIRRVAELDDLMNSPISKAFFHNLDSCSKEDLLLQNKAMRVRLRKAHTERDDAVRKSSLLERTNLHLTKKLERLKEKLSAVEAGDNQRQTVQPHRPRRANNVIILEDSEDEDSEGDVHTVSNNNPDSPVLITESSSSNHNDRYSGRDENHPSLKRQLSLLSDNEDDFTVVEHKIPNIHLSFSRWN